MTYVDPTAVNDTGDLYTGTRQCKQCQEIKDITEFHFTANKIKSRRRVCKACQHKRQAERGLIPEVRAKRRLTGYKTKLRNTYGMTYEDYLAMLEAQDGLCKICSRKLDPESVNDAPHVDHCHKTGRVRGILCFRCNTGLGKFGDDAILLQRAAKYLKN